MSMFSHEKLQKPKTKSLVLTLAVAVAAFYMQQHSSLVGLFVKSGLDGVIQIFTSPP